MFLRAMELISSLDAEVSSSDAACSEAPCASDWLEEETCDAALATCSPPSDSSVTACRKWRFTCRTMNTTTTASISENPMMIIVTNRPWATEACDDLWSSAINRFCTRTRSLVRELTCSQSGTIVCTRNAAASLVLPPVARAYNCWWFCSNLSIPFSRSAISRRASSVSIKGTNSTPGFSCSRAPDRSPGCFSPSGSAPS